MDDACKHLQVAKVPDPVPPPPAFPLIAGSYPKRLGMDKLPLQSYCHVSTATKHTWDRLFDESYRADVVIFTENGGMIYAHASVLGTASPVIRAMLKRAERHGHWRSFSIRGVPEVAVRAFIRFLYSSCYVKEDMKKFVMHLLVLSHVYVVPQLKKLCERHLEHGLLTKENVVDVLQLSLLCDAPRIGLICHRMILKNFKEVFATEGWDAMKLSHPNLEKELLESLGLEEKRRKEKIRKKNEQKIYSQLYEAMEALVHICRDGCKTIGPHDKDLKADQAPCNYSACKGLESLLRHFAACKPRVPGGCVQCKRMWQLLELHSRLCADSDKCRVPLCSDFKERSEKQSKKDETRWKLLVKNVLGTKRIGGSPFFLQATGFSS